MAGSGSDFWPEKKSRLGVSEEKIVVVVVAVVADVVVGSLVGTFPTHSA